MTWKQLYEKRNEDKNVSVPLSWYKDDAETLQWVNSIEIEKSVRLTDDIAFGFIVREDGSEHPKICDNFKIITASNLGPMTDKIVSIKELMHCYENDVAYQTNTEEKLDQLINHFFGHSIQESTEELFVRSEPIAFWRAMAVITTEECRQEVKKDLHENPSRIEYWSNELKMPKFIVAALVGSNFDVHIEKIFNGD